MAGDDFEYLLERELAARGIAFQSERQLRDQGMAKTPDVKLDVPIGVLGPRGEPRGEPRVILRADGKAMVGDPHAHAHALNRAQLEGYVDRYGPGAVFYWHDFVEELKSDHHPAAGPRARAVCHADALTGAARKADHRRAES